MKTEKFQYFRRLLAISYMGIIIYFSHQKDLTFGPDGFGIDKFYHLLEYSILSFLVFYAWGSAGVRYLFLFLFLLLFAASDEVHQYFVGRSCSFYDFGADALGCFAGYQLFKLRFNKRLN